MGAMLDVIAGTLQLGSIQVHTLIDPEASHFFFAYGIVNNLNVPPSRLIVGMTISTPLRENIDIDDVYKGVVLYIEGAELRVDLISLELYYFDLILGMDWLSRHKAQMDCFTKIIVIQRKGEKKGSI